MTRRLFVGLVSASAALASGCGTLLNTAHYPHASGGEEIYGGVQLDYRVVAQEHQKRSATTVALALLDMPFSLVGDTLTLPYTVALAMSREGGAEDPNRKDALLNETWKSAQPGTSVRQAEAEGEPPVPTYERLHGAIGP
jgi:uncharacterized protein YceK